MDWLRLRFFCVKKRCVLYCKDLFVRPRLWSQYFDYSRSTAFQKYYMNLLVDSFSFFLSKVAHCEWNHYITTSAFFVRSRFHSFFNIFQTIDLKLKIPIYF